MTPGVYPGLVEATYHGDADSISASDIKRLLKSPAHHLVPVERTPAMDLGTAVHASVLGVGGPIRYFDYASWNSNAAREALALVRAAGETPMLEKDHERVEAMTASVKAHPTAAKLLTQPGRPELSMFWDDPDWGIQRRCRWDYLTDDGIGIDLKTTSSDLDDNSLARTVVNFAYDVSADWYMTVAEGLEVKVRAFALIFVSSRAPYDVRVVDLDDAWLDRGRRLVDRALTIHRQCTKAGTWPAYTDPSVTTLSLPRWAQED